MELRHLRYFASVAAYGSFNRAAATLHLTQPALSRQVKDLEDELGVRLLVRGKNAVTLTDAGEVFYEEARDLLGEPDQAIQRCAANAAMKSCASATRHRSPPALCPVRWRNSRRQHQACESSSPTFHPER